MGGKEGGREGKREGRREGKRGRPVHVHLLHVMAFILGERLFRTIMNIECHL